MAHSHGPVHQFAAGFVTASMLFTVFAVFMPVLASYNYSVYNTYDADNDGLSNGYDASPFQGNRTEVVEREIVDLCDPNGGNHMAGICGAMCGADSCYSPFCSGYTAAACAGSIHCDNPCADPNCVGHAVSACGS